MPEENAGLSKSFIEEQRKRLEALREQLAQLATTEAGKSSLRNIEGEDAIEPRDIADAGAIATEHETGEALHKVVERRLGHVERALQKIAGGTYGISDSSGQRIPKARLESVPEAIYTIEEESQFESGALDEPKSPTRDGEAHANVTHRRIG
jgi:DnaK suppressor protein